MARRYASPDRLPIPVMRRLRASLRRTGLVALALLAPVSADGQQVADTLFQPSVSAPAYLTGSGPEVLLDEAHDNFHTLAGRYLAFGRLLARDGYAVRPNRGRLTRAVLDSARILVIANALAKVNTEDWFLPTPSAFDTTEERSVRDWVRDGGALLLIADHMPFAGAAEEMAAGFGVLFSNGFVLDSAMSDGDVHYRRSDATLAAHPITAGRSAKERVDSLTAFTGQAFRLTHGGSPLMSIPVGKVLLMPEEAWLFSKRTPRLSADGMLQGAALAFGRGRVAVFGEAAMFSAQVSGPDRTPAGMNVPTAPQNAQFALNVLHWLSALLPPG